MPQLRRLRALLRKGLDETVALWPPIRVAYGYIHKVARLLANEAGLSVSAIRQRLSVVLRQMRASASSGDAPAVGLAHFVKVTRSYRPGLFVCYQVDGVPRTNNDLEQLFGSQRYHERRSNGRKTSSPGLVVRGPVRVIAGVVTRLVPVSGAELAPEDPAAWQELRAKLEQRRAARVLQRRFRRDPKAYLKDLEAKAGQSSLPS